MRIKPHSLFNVWSPDEAAECLPGIGNTDLYTKIWRDIVPLYDGQPRSEVPDDFGNRCLKKYWNKFTDEEKVRLNEAAEAQERMI
jgi:hypothetical protein